MLAALYGAGGVTAAERNRRHVETVEADLLGGSGVLSTGTSYVGDVTPSADPSSPHIRAD